MAGPAVNNCYWHTWFAPLWISLDSIFVLPYILNFLKLNSVIYTLSKTMPSPTELEFVLYTLWLFDIFSSLRPSSWYIRWYLTKEVQILSKNLLIFRLDLLPSPLFELPFWGNFPLIRQFEWFTRLFFYFTRLLFIFTRHFSYCTRQSFQKFNEEFSVICKIPFIKGLSPKRTNLSFHIC